MEYVIAQGRKFAEQISCANSELVAFRARATSEFRFVIRVEDKFYLEKRNLSYNCIYYQILYRKI